MYEVENPGCLGNATKLLVVNMGGEDTAPRTHILLYIMYASSMEFSVLVEINGCDVWPCRRHNPRRGKRDERRMMFVTYICHL